MLVERAPIRALAHFPVCKATVSMPRISSTQSRRIQTACSAISTPSKPEQRTQRLTPPTSRQVAVRLASTASNSPSQPSLKAQPSASSLTWDQFLQLRKVRRRYNLVASVLFGAQSAFAGAGYLSTIDLNTLSATLFGIDPMMALGISTVGCGALGWLIGPFAGETAFNLMHRSVKNDILVKEKDFFHRIRRHRADISAGGNLQNNPFPDYYGEKIDSVKGYRQWLRDQKKFSKKRQYQGE